MSAKQTEIVADPAVPTIVMTREFDAPPARVFEAMMDPELFVQWIGPDSITTVVEEWDANTGGKYRYRSTAEGFEGVFYGSFHEVRPGERVVQTFTFEGFPDGVSLETITFEELDGGRTRVRGLSVVESVELRDQMLASGMEVGVNEGYAKLDRLLAGSA